MKNDKLKRVVALILAFSLMSSHVLFAKGDEDKRNEFVFSVFENGQIKEEKTVSVWQTSDKEINFSEKTNLENVKNLKSSDLIDRVSNKINWKTDNKDLYYQGKSKRELPIDINLNAKLDGKTVDYTSLDNVNGHLTLTIQLENKEYKDVKIDGENRKIFRPYLADIAFIADNSSVNNFEHNIGEITKDGSRIVLNAVMAPGMKETFQNDLDILDIEEINDIKDKLVDELTIEMDVKNFKPQAIMIGFTNLDLNI